MSSRALLGPLLGLACLIAAALAPTASAAQDSITNTYASIALKYGITASEAAAAIGPTISLPQAADLDLPEQIHVFYNSWDQVVISWFTGAAQATNDTSSPFTTPNTSALASDVRYGSRLLQTASGTAQFYRMIYSQDPRPQSGLTGTVSMLTNFTNYTSGVIHRVTLSNLPASTVVMYQVGDFTRHKVSEVLSFKTLPQPSTTFQKVRIGIFADIAITANSSTTIERAAQAQPDLAILVGDYAYANIHGPDGSFAYFVVDQLQYSQGSRWDVLGRLLQPLLSAVPFLGCQGNHERERQPDSFFKPWLSRYGDNMPTGTTGSPFYYSAAVGPVHVISLSPYVDYSATSAQYLWLVSDLKAINRTVTPWVLVQFHAPWYVTVASHFQENECHRALVEPLLYKYGVDIVISGHSHLYERSHKVYNYNADSCGATHLVVGNAGIGLNTVFADSQMFGPTLTNSSRYNHSGPCPLPVASPTGIYVWLATNQTCMHRFDNGNFCPPTQPAYSAYREPSFGSAMLEFENATHAKVRYMRNASPPEDGMCGLPAVADDAWITRDPSCTAAARRSRHRRSLRRELEL